MDETTIANQWNLALMVMGLIVQALALIIGGVWVVAKIQATTASLKTTLVFLTESVNRLQAWLSTVDRHVDNLNERVTRIETKLDTRGCRPEEPLPPKSPG